MMPGHTTPPRDKPAPQRDPDRCPSCGAHWDSHSYRDDKGRLGLTVPRCPEKEGR